MGGFMLSSRLVAAYSAALLLAATMPQLAQARELVGFSDAYSSGTVVVKPASGRSIMSSAAARPCAIRSVSDGPVSNGPGLPGSAAST
jgi:hypothetical protein